jgi:gag-polyprotein putative aspartyl protease
MLTARLLIVRCRRFRCCLRLLCRRYIQFLLLIPVIALPGALAAQVRQSNEIIKFRLRDGYLIIVQTRVNGAGPFSFLLDTGTTRTVIDPGLARQLQAPAIGVVTLNGMLRRRQDKLVKIHDVRMGQASVSDLGAIVDELPRQKLLVPGIRGVLGEDFLSHFDFLIDYKGRLLRFGDAPPTGERCRFETMSKHDGMLTTNRLLVGVEFTEVSGDNIQLQLDTGAKMPELFPVGGGSPSSQPWNGSMVTSSGANSVVIYSNTAIRIGTTTVRGLDVVQSRRALTFDAAGLLPASIFHRIYISHSGGFVVLNPGE